MQSAASVFHIQTMTFDMLIWVKTLIIERARLLRWLLQLYNSISSLSFNAPSKRTFCLNPLISVVILRRCPNWDTTGFSPQIKRSDLICGESVNRNQQTQDQATLILLEHFWIWFDWKTSALSLNILSQNSIGLPLMYCDCFPI